MFRRYRCLVSFAGALCAFRLASLHGCLFGLLLHDEADGIDRKLRNKTILGSLEMYQNLSEAGLEHRRGQSTVPRCPTGDIRDQITATGNGTPDTSRPHPSILHLALFDFIHAHERCDKGGAIDPSHPDWFADLA